MSRALLRAAGRDREAPKVEVGTVLAELGDKSFGWALALFALVNMLPAPYGSTLFTSPPVMIVAAQMALGRRHLWLPRFVTRVRVRRDTLRRAVIRLRPLIRPVERLLRPRWGWMFSARNERLIGLAFIALAVAIFAPLPLTGAFPAFCILICALALLERDGMVMAGGLALGAVAFAVFVAVISALLAGVETLL